MKAVLLSLFLIITTLGNAQLLGASFFQRLSDTEFRVHSFFTGGNSTCFQNQARSENLQNDTLFLKIVFETRVIVDGLGCERYDTIQQTLFNSEIDFINVSTGVITFDDNDPTLADTIWSMYDSTFTAVLGLPDLQTNDLKLFYSQNQLLIQSPQTISAIELFDLNGKRLFSEQGNQLDVSTLQTGIYLLRLFSQSGSMGTIRWFRE
jgi:hypothetical protein